MTGGALDEHLDQIHSAARDAGPVAREQVGRPLLSPPALLVEATTRTSQGAGLCVELADQAGLDLDAHQLARAGEHQVDLAAGCADAATDESRAGERGRAREVVRGQGLARAAELEAIRTRSAQEGRGQAPQPDRTRQADDYFSEAASTSSASTVWMAWRL